MAPETETLEAEKQEDAPNVEEEIEAKDMEDFEKEGEEDQVIKEKEEEEEEEAKDEESEDEEEAEESKSSSKRGRKGSAKKGDASSKKVKTDPSSKEPVTPVDRPTRERKTIERYTESMSRLSATKPFSIEKGTGTQLKDIPNVAYKLSKRKPDDNLQSLHTILFGKRAKVNTLKKNIGMFSGFVWADDEQERQRTKVKEKLDKCVKEKLFDFCDILNLQIHKSSLKKEEVSLKLLEFLQSPHATTDILLAEKEQKGKKRKAKAKRSRSRTPSKKQSGEKRKRSSKMEEENTMDEDEGSESEDDSQEEDDKGTLSKPESDKEEDEEEEETEKSKKNVKKNNPKKDVKSPTKSNKKSPSSGSSSKKSKEEKNSKKEEVKKESSKDQGKGKTNKAAKAEPTNEEMHAVVVIILKEVDFNTATLSDIIKQLGTHFGQDLLHRKAEVKAIITDVINNMSGEDEEAEPEANAADDEDS